jgi:hypothetical protein
MPPIGCISFLFSLLTAIQYRGTRHHIDRIATSWVFCNPAEHAGHSLPLTSCASGATFEPPDRFERQALAHPSNRAATHVLLRNERRQLADTWSRSCTGRSNEHEVRNTTARTARPDPGKARNLVPRTRRAPCARDPGRVGGGPDILALSHRRRRHRRLPRVSTSSGNDVNSVARQWSRTSKGRPAKRSAR